MKAKNFFGLLIVALFMVLGLNMSAQNAVHPKSYYDAITYSWTDAGGATHENSITDLATDPYQIVALLKKVYCDPNIPGPLYSAYDKDNNREREVYYGPVDGGWNISASDVTTPYEDGYTLLMVSLNNNVTPQGGNNTYDANYFTQTSQLINYIQRNVTSVQLLVDGLRIGTGDQAGTAFNISGNYNRFFLLGKGQAREKDIYALNAENNSGVPAGEEVPFKKMFEQFSPTSGYEGSQIRDFYARMVAGQVYPVIHDCMSVIENEHDFSMAGKNATEYKSLTGMNMFIPDYRLKYYEKDTSWTEYVWIIIPIPQTVEGAYDGRTQNAYTATNGTEFGNARYITAHYAVYNPDYAPRMGIYNINLEAEANLASQEQTFDVVLDWTSSLDNLGHESVPQTYTVYIVVTDEEGNEVLDELIITDQTSYTYQVPQNEHSYTITYVVYGQPSDGEHDVFVAWSNQASVTIPGWYDFLALTLNHYESDYVPAEQLNYYRNFLNVENEDILNALTPARISAGEDEFTLYRFDAALPDVLIPIATLKLTLNGSNVRYNITYDNQEDLAGYTIDIPTSGNLGNYGNDEAINLGDILFIDRFNANTADNNHPSRYGYVLVSGDKSSTSVEVPVFKTSSTIDGFYTDQQILDDIDAQLTCNVMNANVEMNLSSNPNVYYYTLDRRVNDNPIQVISKIQRRTDGTYEEMLNVLPQYYNSEYEPGTVYRLDNLVEVGAPGDHIAYQPVIWTFGNDRVKQDGDNSYGSPIWKTGVGEVNANVSGTRSTGEYGTYQDPDGNYCSIFNPFIHVIGELPEDASVIYEPYMYRVWRVCDDIRPFYIRASSGKPHFNPNGDTNPFALIVEDFTNESEIIFGSSNDELAFGALRNAQIKFLVRFYYKKAANRDEANDAPMYYVVEKLVDWTEIATSVEELKVAGEVSKVYINPQGIQSDTPFDGVNIVITTNSDGSTTTGKLIK